MPRRRMTRDIRHWHIYCRFLEEELQEQLSRPTQCGNSDICDILTVPRCCSLLFTAGTLVTHWAVATCHGHVARHTRSQCRISDRHPSWRGAMTVWQSHWHCQCRHRARRPKRNLRYCTRELRVAAATWQDSQSQEFNQRSDPGINHSKDALKTHPAWHGM